MTESRSLSFRWSVAFCCFLWAISGCKKSGSGAPGDPGVVVLTVADLNPNGSISDQALQTIDKEANASTLTVIVSRTMISDEALAQLTKYPNLRRVQAMGSPLSDAGIEKLKAAIPSVQILK